MRDIICKSESSEKHVSVTFCSFSLISCQSAID